MTHTREVLVDKIECKAKLVSPNKYELSFTNAPEKHPLNKYPFLTFNPTEGYYMVYGELVSVFWLDTGESFDQWDYRQRFTTVVRCF